MRPFSLLVLVCLKFVISVDAQGHFVKDQYLHKHQFPPAIPKPPKGIPQGHLRPLGYQKLSDGKVKAFGPATPLQMYQTRCIEKSRPCLLRNHYHPPAEQLWTDKYLARNFKENEITVRVKHGKVFQEEKMKLINFLKKYHYDEWSLKTNLFEPMKNDLTVPAFLQCPSQLENILDANFWLSSGPVDSNIRIIGSDQLFCVFSGRADFILIDGEYQYAFNMQDYLHKNSGSAISAIDAASVNMFEHKQIAEVPWHWATALHGDCVYIPRGFIHQVKTYGRSISVIFNTASLAENQNCNDSVADIELPFNQTQTLWIHEGEKKKPNVKEWSYDLVMKYLNCLMGKQSRLYIEQFTHFYNTVANKPSSEVREAWDAFKEFDNDLTGWISREQMDGTPKHKFKWLTALLESRRKGVPMKDEL